MNEVGAWFRAQPATLDYEHVPLPNGSGGSSGWGARPGRVIDARNYVDDWSANPTAWTAYWQAAHDAAIAAGAELVVTPGVYKLDLTPGAKINVSSGFRMRGAGPHVIRCYNGNATTTTGSGFDVNAATSDRIDVAFERLTFEGDNGSSWGSAFDASALLLASSSQPQTMCIRFTCNSGKKMRNMRVVGCTFRNLWGFPAQCIVGNGQDASGFFFDDNAVYQVVRAFNVSAPYSSVSRNKWRQAQIAEIAAPFVTIVGNTATDFYGNFSLGAASVSDARYRGYVVLGNSFDTQLQSNASFVIGTTDGAEGALIAHNQIRRANGAGILLGASASSYGAPRGRVTGNMLASIGNVANGLTTRYGIWVGQDNCDVIGNTIWNDPADAGVWQAVAGLVIQANDGSYDLNRLDGATWHVQFDATSANTKAARNYWGAGNVYATTKVSFLRAPTSLPFFTTGSVMRFDPSGTFARPAASVNYRGLRALTQGGAGVADTDAVCVKDAADAYAWKDLF